MPVCKFCNHLLSESVLVVDAASNQFKSCPKCSSGAGYHIFYRYDDFGMRNIRDDQYIVQSWCSGCRSNNTEIRPEEQFTCKKLTANYPVRRKTPSFMAGRMSIIIINYLMPILL